MSNVRSTELATLKRIYTNVRDDAIMNSFPVPTAYYLSADSVRSVALLLLLLFITFHLLLPEVRCCSFSA